MAEPASDAVATGTTDPVAGPAVPRRRLVSLDAFRGLTIAAMLLVNNPGSWSHVYGPLQHAEWHGWTPTDLIFPFFLFIVGVSMTYSFRARRRRGAETAGLLRKSVRRAVVLFLLGLLLHAFPWHAVDLSTLRIPGVLQRIAVAYLAASVIVLLTGLRAQIAATAVLLLGYWAVMTLVPVPGGTAGDLSPDGNLAGWVDRTLLGTEHLWSQSRTWDPEGVLSTVPAIATVLLGVFTGRWLQSDRTGPAITAGMLTAGIGAVAIGWLWGQLFPINKNLWTSSYVFFTGGMALLLFGLLYWVVDVRDRRPWATPFVVFGVNAIAAYFLSSLFAQALDLVHVGGGLTLKAWAYGNLFASWAGPLNGSLAFAVAFVLLWLGLMWSLYRRKIYIKV